MPGPAGQGLRDRRRRTAALLSKSIREAAQAPDGATSAGRKRSATQSAPAAPEALSVPVVQAESVPNREPGCCEQLLEYIGWRTESGANRLSGFSVDASLNIKLDRDQRASAPASYTPHTRKHTQARARTHKHAHTYTHTHAHVRNRHTRRRWTQEREDAPRIQDRMIVSLSRPSHPLHHTEI